MITQVVLASLVARTHLGEVQIGSASIASNLKQAHGPPFPYSGYTRGTATVLSNPDEFNANILASDRCLLPRAQLELLSETGNHFPRFARRSEQ